MKNRIPIDDIVIDKLRQHQPKLNHSEELTLSIMAAIENTKPQTLPRFVSYLRIISSTAALFLGILFLSQLLLTKKTIQTTSTFTPCSTTYKPAYDEDINTTKTTVFSLYLSHLQYNSQKNKLLETLKN